MKQTSAGSHTQREILSQPQVWAKTIHRLQKLEPSGYPNIADYDQVVFSGCGSTYYLSRWAARVCESAHGVISRAVPASDLLLFPEAWWHAGKRTLFVAVSRSGETTETIRALEHFQAASLGDIIVVTCYPECHLARLAQYVIAVPDAHEESVAQTRSFSNMLLAVIWLITRDIPGNLPAVFSEVGQQLIAGNVALAERIGRDESIERLFFLGSGPMYGLANEAMLKMKEMSLSYSESFHFHEFRHGPMSMVNGHSLIVGLISDSAAAQQYTLLREMKAMGAQILGLQDKGDPQAAEALDDQVLFRSGIAEIWRAPFYLPVLQLMAYERSIHKGLNPDLPVNLKSVVVLDDNLF
jgi:glucosamine--fructose-6-phosphate aminotransferase (isomerizing)